MADFFTTPSKTSTDATTPVKMGWNGKPMEPAVGFINVGYTIESDDGTQTYINLGGVPLVASMEFQKGVNNSLDAVSPEQAKAMLIELVESGQLIFSYKANRPGVKKTTGKVVGKPVSWLKG